MPGGIVTKKSDQVVNDIPARDAEAVNWNISDKGRGVLVLNAFKDYPGAGQGDPTVATVSNAFYKWTGAAFTKVSEGESLDVDFKQEYFAGTGALAVFNISEAGNVFLVEVGGQIIEPVAGAGGYQVAGQVVTLGWAPEAGQRVGIYFYN